MAETKTGTKTETKAAPEPRKDYLELDLKEPVEYQGMTITKLDMRKLREMKGRDLNVLYNLYGSLGGTETVLQEGTLLFAQVAASRVCGLPVEAVMELSARDSIYLKSRVYRFFYGTE